MTLVLKRLGKVLCFGDVWDEFAPHGRLLQDVTNAIHALKTRFPRTGYFDTTFTGVFQTALRHLNVRLGGVSDFPDCGTLFSDDGAALRRVDGQSDH